MTADLRERLRTLTRKHWVSGSVIGEQAADAAYKMAMADACERLRAMADDVDIGITISSRELAIAAYKMAIEDAANAALRAMPDRKAIAVIGEAAHYMAAGAAVLALADGLAARPADE